MEQGLGCLAFRYIEKDVRNTPKTGYAFLFFSDQEPPYSMITLHEMAETGNQTLRIHIYTLTMDLSDGVVST